ncbi:hypothetical protein FBALC1_16412 [Flavobacteriales bacterium ALC-1]|nr:hypothetical protein FBALC1_16412 [Flavobacteriales bacterium ALC-1]
MKFLFSLLAIIMLSESCNSTKETISDAREVISASKSEKDTTKEKSDIDKDGYKITVTYQISTRGFYEYTSVSESEILFSKDRGLQKIDNYSCKKKDWIVLYKLIEAVDLETFQKLKPPSNKRSTDAVPIGNLALQIGDVYYMAPEFDHGNPPKEIEALVNKVLSIKENTIKQ